MAGEANANRSYRFREAGVYVVNPRTHIAVAGPFRSTDHAQTEAKRRDMKWGSAPDPLTVEVVGPVAVA